MRGEVFILSIPRGELLPLDKRRPWDILTPQGSTIPVRFESPGSRFSVCLKRVAWNGMPAGAGEPLWHRAGWESDCTSRALAAAVESAAPCEEEITDSKEKPVTWQREVIPFAKGRSVFLRSHAWPCRISHVQR